MHWTLGALSLCLLGGPQEVERTLRSYDISFLTQEVPQFPAKNWNFAGKLLLEEVYLTEEGEPSVGLTLDSGEERAGTRISPEGLVALIWKNIAEDSWANERNSIEAGREPRPPCRRARRGDGGRPLRPSDRG